MDIVDLIAHNSDPDGLEIILFSRPLRDLIEQLSYIRRLERTWRLIESSYEEPNLTLAKASIEIGINKNHLNVLLRERTAYTFHQLLVRYRLYKAIGRMMDKNYSLLELAMDTGFGSLNTFERNFRNILGVPPKLFKHSVRTGEIKSVGWGMAQ